MRALVIDPTTTDQVNKLVERAALPEHWFNPRDQSEGWLERLPGHRPEHIIKIFDGFRCVFSYTLDTKLQKVFRHLSVSVLGSEDRVPSPEAMVMLGHLFGFTGEAQPAPRVLPLEWMAHVHQDHQFDGNCVIVAQETDLDPAKIDGGGS